MEEELRHDNVVIPDALPPAPPPPATPPPPESLSLPPHPEANRAVRRLGMGDQQSAESALERSPSPASPQDSPQASDWPPMDGHYPTPPPAPLKDQWDSESIDWDRDDDEGCPVPFGPMKIFRNGRLHLHKAYRGPLPIGYVDTGLYEGGRRDWFEAFTPQDLTWARRMDYVLRRHNICRH